MSIFGGAMLYALMTDNFVTIGFQYVASALGGQQVLLVANGTSTVSQTFTGTSSVWLP